MNRQGHRHHQVSNHKPALLHVSKRRKRRHISVWAILFSIIDQRRLRVFAAEYFKWHAFGWKSNAGWKSLKVGWHFETTRPGVWLKIDKMPCKLVQNATANHFPGLVAVIHARIITTWIGTCSWDNGFCFNRFFFQIFERLVKACL